MSKRLIIAMMLLSLCTACVQSTVAPTTELQHSNSELVEIANGLMFELQANNDVIKAKHDLSTQQLQSVTIEFDKQTKQLLVASEISREKLNMVAMSPAGMVLFEITWRYGSAIEVTRSEMLKNISALNILADFQLVTLPLTQLQYSLPKAVIVENGDISRMVRTITYKDESLISIEYIGNQQINFIHHQRKYQIKIKTLESSSL